jgi:hypothetical protein
MKKILRLILLCLCSVVFAAEPASPARAIVIKLAWGYDAETAVDSFRADGLTGIDGVDTILTDWVVTAIEPVVWRSELKRRNPELFTRMGMNRYLVIGWGPDAAERPPYIINRMLTQLREQDTVEEADRVFTLASE